MEVEIISPFLLSVNKVVSQMCDVSCSFDDPFHTVLDYKSDDSIIILGIEGELEGSIVLNFSHASALNVASLMIRQEQTILNEIGQSALCELGNMIAGNSATVFSMRDINVDVTVPEYLNGDEIDLSENIEVLRIPVILPNEKFNVDVLV